MTSPATLRPPAWTHDALCDGHPAGPAAWDNDTPTARAICADCPVRLQCATHALEHAIPSGTWGGLTPLDRRRIARDYGYDHPGAAAHGERSRYVAGCRCGLCRRAHARYEHARRLRARAEAPPIVLDTPQGRGRWTAWPGQVIIVYPGTDTATLRIAA